MNKNLSRIYILIIIIIYAHTKHKNMLTTLGYILYMCHISDNPRQYIYLNTSCKLHYAWKILVICFFVFLKVKNENNK